MTGDEGTVIASFPEQESTRSELPSERDILKLCVSGYR